MEPVGFARAVLQSVGIECIAALGETEGKRQREVQTREVTRIGRLAFG